MCLNREPHSRYASGTRQVGERFTPVNDTQTIDRHIGMPYSIGRFDIQIHFNGVLVTTEPGTANEIIDQVTTMVALGIPSAHCVIKEILDTTPPQIGSTAVSTTVTEAASIVVAGTKFEISISFTPSALIVVESIELIKSSLRLGTSSFVQLVGTLLHNSCGQQLNDLLEVFHADIDNMFSTVAGSQVFDPTDVANDINEPTGYVPPDTPGLVGAVAIIGYGSIPVGAGFGPHANPLVTL